MKIIIAMDARCQSTLEKHTLLCTTMTMIMYVMTIV